MIFRIEMGHAQNDLRHLGMIQTSGSWRRFWLAWHWAKYPFFILQK
jgi:hypothetical protein